MTHILFLAILGLPSRQASADVRDVCIPRAAGKSMVSIDYGDRVVHVVGWEHLDEEDNSRLQRAALESAKSAYAGHCRPAERALDRALQASTLSLRKADGVGSSLEDLNAVTPLALVGREISPSEWTNLSRDFGKYQDLFAVIEKCGPRARTLVGRMRDVLFGPEMKFTSKHLNAAVFPYEDYELRVENSKSFVEKVRLDFDDDQARISKTAAFREIKEALWTETEPSEASIRELAKALGGLRYKAESQIRADIAVWKKRVRGAYVRNDAIVRNVGQVRASAALVIGHRHVRDLVEKLARDCRRRWPVAKMPPVYYPTAPYATGATR